MQSKECNYDQQQHEKAWGFNRTDLEKEKCSFGFVLTRNLDKVYLVRKKQSESADTFLTGIRACKRSNETFHDAIARHANEMAGYTGEFYWFGVLSTSSWYGYLFFSVIAPEQPEPKARLGELIEKIPVNHFQNKFSTIDPDLPPWLMETVVDYYNVVVSNTLRQFKANSAPAR